MCVCRQSKSTLLQQMIACMNSRLPVSSLYRVSRGFDFMRRNCCPLREFEWLLFAASDAANLRKECVKKPIEIVEKHGETTY